MREFYKSNGLDMDDLQRMTIKEILELLQNTMTKVMEANNQLQMQLNVMNTKYEIVAKDNAVLKNDNIKLTKENARLDEQNFKLRIQVASNTKEKNVSKILSSGLELAK